MTKPEMEPTTEEEAIFARLCAHYIQRADARQPLPPAPGEETPYTLKQQDRLRAAVFPLGAGNSELEPDGQGSRSCRADRQSGEDRQIGGRAAFLSGGLQCSQRDVRGGIVENDHVSEVARGPEARATLPPAPGESA